MARSASSALRCTRTCPAGHGPMDVWTGRARAVVRWGCCGLSTARLQIHNIRIHTIAPNAARATQGAGWCHARREDAGRRHLDASLFRSTRARGPTQFITTTFRPELIRAGTQFYGVTHRHKVSTIKSIDMKEALRIIAEDKSRALQHAS